MALPGLPIIPPINPAPAAKKVGDVAVKDEKVRASTLIREETGWRGNNARIALAVMGAESSYNPNAENYCCVGLMQVNVLAHAGKFGMSADKDKARQEMKNPRDNLHVAYQIFQAQGWDAWETFTNERYKLFIGQDPIITTKKRSLQGEVGGAINDAASAVLSPLDTVFGALTNPSTWLRIGKGYLGSVFVIVGTGALVFIVANKASKTPAGSTAVKIAKVIPK